MATSSFSTPSSSHRRSQWFFSIVACVAAETWTLLVQKLGCLSTTHPNLDPFKWGNSGTRFKIREHKIDDGVLCMHGSVTRRILPGSLLLCPISPPLSVRQNEIVRGSHAKVEGLPASTTPTITTTTSNYYKWTRGEDRSLILYANSPFLLFSSLQVLKELEGEGLIVHDEGVLHLRRFLSETVPHHVIGFPPSPSTDLGRKVSGNACKTILPTRVL